MHIILLIILAVSGLIWGIITLQREIRRRQWAKQNTTPLFSLEDPRELAVVLSFGYTKLGGDPTTEQKEQLIAYYQSEFKYSPDAANEMYSYASFVVGTDPNYADKVPQIVKPCIEKINAEQKHSIINLLGELNASPTAAQSNFKEEITRAFA